MFENDMQGIPADHDFETMALKLSCRICRYIHQVNVV